MATISNTNPGFTDQNIFTLREDTTDMTYPLRARAKTTPTPSASAISFFMQEFNGRGATFDFFQKSMTLPLGETPMKFGFSMIGFSREKIDKQIKEVERSVKRYAHVLTLKEDDNGVFTGVVEDEEHYRYVYNKPFVSQPRIREPGATNSAPTRTDNTEKQETLCWTSHFLLNIWNCFVNAVKALINCIFPQRSGSRSKEEAEAAISFMAQVDGEICIAEQAEQEERQLKPAVKIEPAEGSNIALALKSMAEQQLKEAESAISFMARVDGEICIAEQEERQLKPAVKIEPTEGSNIALALKSMAE